MITGEFMGCLFNVLTSTDIHTGLCVSVCLFVCVCLSAQREGLLISMYTEKWLNIRIYSWNGCLYQQIIEPYAEYKIIKRC